MGELLALKEHVFGTTVWGDDLASVIDSLESKELVTAVKCEDDCGWTRVMTSRGLVGFIHRNNLRRIV